MYMIYRPQGTSAAPFQVLSLTRNIAPTAFTNSPVFIKSQVDLIVELIKKLRAEDIKSIEAKHDFEKQ